MRYVPSVHQQGSSLLEALVAILIFSIGLLALIGLQAVSIKNSIDAKYRADASYLANQIVAQMWVDRGNLDAYAHRVTGASCAFTGADSANSNVTAWINEIVSILPGAAATKVQILLSTPIASTRQVQVTVCWQGPQEASAHNFVATAHINQ